MTMGTDGKRVLARVMIRRHTIVWVLAAGFLAALMGPASAGAAELPEKDPFYKPPAAGEPHEHWQEEAPGTVLKKREISIYGYSAYQLLFRSNNGRGEPIVAVTTVGIPRNPYTGVGERPFVSYQMAIDSLGSQCSPSYELQQGSEDEEGEAAVLLEKGWYVNIPDHEGEDMEFAAGPNGAHITLDSIRAAYNAGIGISTKNPLGLIGYSGGGQATDFAMLEQPTYAPELHILAAAPGGIPVDIQETVEHNNGGAAFGLVIGGTIGVNRGFPELELYSLLNAEGLSTFKTVEKQCLIEYVSNPSYAFKKFSEYTKPEYAEPLTLPKVEHVTALDSIGTAPGMPNDGLPSYPVLLWQSKADEIVPPAGVEKLANYYCSEGVDVTFDLGASGEHITYLDNAPVAVAYLEARFNGESVASTCGVNASENTRIGSGPSGTLDEQSATFTYSAEPEVAGTSFECKLDGAEFASCPASATTYTGLALGQHTFAVRSVTATGAKDVSPATRTWDVGKPRNLPELGRCVKVAKGQVGAYEAKNCVHDKVGKHDHDDWLPGPGAKKAFTGKSQAVSFETATKKSITCGSATLAGEYTGAKTETASLVLTGCKYLATNQPCQTSLTAEGTIEASSLAGELGFIHSSPTPETPTVGWSLKGLSATFTCYKPPETSIVKGTIEGSVIGAVTPVDRMSKNMTVTYTVSSGKQSPESFEYRLPDALTTKLSSGIEETVEQSGLKMTESVSNGESLEIRGHTCQTYSSCET